MKKAIEDYLKTDRTYEKGVQLYHKHGLKMSLKKQLNVQAESDYMKGILFEEFREMLGISALELKNILAHPVVPLKIVTIPVKLTPLQEIELLFMEIKNYEILGDLPAIKKALSKIDVLIPAAGGDVHTKFLKIANEFNYTDDPKKVPVDIKRAIKLRDEFPFLKEADCPAELKILVADMLTAYETYKAAHETLFTVQGEEELLDTVKEVVEKFIENREIWDELNYYKENKEVLGKHVIFKVKNLQEEIDAMPNAELVSELNNAKSNISKVKSKISKSKGDPKQKEWSDNLQLLEIRKEKIEKRLGIVPKKR